MSSTNQPAMSFASLDFQAIYDQSPVSTQVFNPTGATIYVNSAWEELFQASKEVASHFNILQDEQLAASGALPFIQRAFSGQPVQLPAVPFDSQKSAVHGKNGTRWIRGMFYPVKDAGGSVTAVVVQHLDITDLRLEEDRLRASAEELEVTIVERTAELRARLEQIEAQQQEISALAAPLIPLTNDVVVLPLIGSVSAERANLLHETAISGVAEYHAHIVILDVTGVPVVDTQVANTIVRTAQAVKLLGAEIVLTGIRPEVAQTLVGIGADLIGVRVHRSLQSAVEALVGRKS